MGQGPAACVRAWWEGGGQDRKNWLADLEDFSASFFLDWVGPWNIMFSRFHTHRMLGDHDLMLGAAGFFFSKWENYGL